MRKLLLIDGNNLFHRNRHTNKELKTSTGIGTGGIFGTLRSVFSLVKDFPYHTVVIAWDAWSASRAMLYPEYKSNRAGKMTEEERKDVFQQLHDVRAMLPMLGLPRVRIGGLEADDIIAWLAWCNRDVPVTIVSTDKDIYQCMTAQVTWVPTAVDILNMGGAIKKMDGLLPLQHRLYHAIAGDTSDGIKGVPGVGEVSVKTIMAALPEGFDYEHVDWENLGQICLTLGGRPAKVAAHLDILRRNWDLVNLVPPTFMSPVHGNMIKRALTIPLAADLAAYCDQLQRFEFTSMLESFNLISWHRDLMDFDYDWINT